MCKSYKTPMCGLMIFGMFMMMIPAIFLILLSPQVTGKQSWDWFISYGILLLWPAYHLFFILVLIACQKPFLNGMIPITFAWLVFGHLICLYLLLNASHFLSWYKFPTHTGANSPGKTNRLYYDRDDMWWIFVSFAFTWFSFTLQIAYSMHIRNLYGLTSFGCGSR